MSDDEEPSAQEGFVQASEIRMQPVADYDKKVSARALGVHSFN